MRFAGARQLLGGFVPLKGLGPVRSVCTPMAVVGPSLRRERAGVGDIEAVERPVNSKRSNVRSSRSATHSVTSAAPNSSKGRLQTVCVVQLRDNLLLSTSSAFFGEGRSVSPLPNVLRHHGATLSLAFSATNSVEVLVVWRNVLDPGDDARTGERADDAFDLLGVGGTRWPSGGDADTPTAGPDCDVSCEYCSV